MNTEALTASELVETNLVVTGGTSVEIVSYSEVGELLEPISIDGTRQDQPHPDVAREESSLAQDVSDFPFSIGHLSLPDSHIVIQAPAAAEKFQVTNTTITNLSVDSHAAYGRSRERARYRRAA